MSDVDKVQEILKAHIFEMYHNNYPYDWFNRVVGWTPMLDGTLRIEIELMVLSEHDVGVVLGKESRDIKKLWLNSKSDIERLYQRPVKLVIKIKTMKKEMRRDVKSNRKIEMEHPRFIRTEEMSKKTLRLADSTDNN